MSLEEPHEGKLKILFIGPKKQGKSTMNGQLLYQTHPTIFGDRVLEFIEDERNYEYFLRALPKYFMQAPPSKNDPNIKDWDALIKGFYHDDVRKDRMTAEVYLNEWSFSGASTRILSIDTPGNKHLISEWIKGLIIADIAVFVVSAKNNEYTVLETESETGRDLLLLLKTFNHQSVIFCVNFMDDEYVKWSDDTFEEVRAYIENFLTKEQIFFKNRYYIPTSAYLGDNIINPSQNMPWYTGLPLLDVIQTISTKIRENKTSLRILIGNEKEITVKNKKIAVAFGIVESGNLSKNESQLVVYPQGLEISARFYDMAGCEVNEAHDDDYIYMQVIDPEYDLKSLCGSLISKSDEAPFVSNAIQAYLLVLAKTLVIGDDYSFYFNNKSYLCKITACLDIFYAIKDPESDESYLFRPPKYDSKIVSGSIMSRTLDEVIITLDENIAFERYDTNKSSSLCRFIMKKDNEIVAIGLITKEVASDGI